MNEFSPHRLLEIMHGVVVSILDHSETLRIMQWLLPAFRWLAVQKGCATDELNRSTRTERTNPNTWSKQSLPYWNTAADTCLMWSYDANQCPNDCRLAVVLKSVPCHSLTFARTALVHTSHYSLGKGNQGNPTRPMRDYYRAIRPYWSGRLPLRNGLYD